MLFSNRVKLTALYKHLITKTTLTYISANKTLNIAVYHYRLSNNNYIYVCLSVYLSLSHTHTHARTHAHPNLRSSTQIQQLINDLDNNTKFSLSSHQPLSCTMLCMLSYVAYTLFLAITVICLST